LTAEWASRLETLGQSIQVRWQDRVEEGVATSVDDRGNLMLTQPDGAIKTVVAGEVTLQR
jgi:biotin-(acetyl-CoA carboxylase) ligase